MNKIKATGFLALTIAALTLTGCSGGSSEPAAPTTTPAPVTVPTEAMTMPKKDTPKPDAAQSKKLLADLGKVSPELGKPVSAEKSRVVCEDILAGKSEDEVLKRIHVVFDGDASAPLSEPQATDVLKFIKDSGYCKK